MVGSRNERIALAAIVSGAMLALLALCAGMAMGQAGDPGQGRRFIDRYCSDCHQTGTTIDRRRNDPAPPFNMLTDYPRDDLVNLLAAQHSEMPYIEVSEEQINNIIAYLHDLAM